MFIQNLDPDLSKVAKVKRAMDETTLLFRHLPVELTKEERESLFYHLGASRVRVMGQAGFMKNTAFAVFPSKAKATEVVEQLHQVEVLGSRLIVEFARQTSQGPSVVDGQSKQTAFDGDKDGKQMSPSGDQKVSVQSELKFDSTFNVWGLHHPRRPELKYLYPPPSPSVLTNIMNTLVAVPKFYTQVLHLMNKMDLPAPFGTVTVTPPMHSDVILYSQPDDVHQQEMDISSDTESELDSDPGSQRSKKNVQTKPRGRPTVKKSRMKRPRLSDLQDIPPTSQPQPVPPPIPVKEVFDQMPDSSQSQKKMELKIPSAILAVTDKQVEPQHPTSLPQTDVSIGSTNQKHHGFANQFNVSLQQEAHYHYHQQKQRQNQTSVIPDQCTPLPPPPPPPPPPPTQSAGQPKQAQNLEFWVKDLPGATTENTRTDEPSESSLSRASAVEGFGLIQPKAKPTSSADEQAQSTEERWTKAQFISSNQLKRSKLSETEMKELSVFRKYNPGEASCRLYIKNVAKSVTDKDLHWIYGRYVDWDNEMETNIFDIRLMKEGRMKGQAFVTLPSSQVAMAALSDTNGFLLKDKPLVVQFARSAKAAEEDT